MLPFDVPEFRRTLLLRRIRSLREAQLLGSRLVVEADSGLERAMRFVFSVAARDLPQLGDLRACSYRIGPVQAALEVALCSGLELRGWIGPSAVGRLDQPGQDRWVAYVDGGSEAVLRWTSDGGVPDLKGLRPALSSRRTIELSGKEVSARLNTIGRRDWSSLVSLAYEVEAVALPVPQSNLLRNVACASGDTDLAWRWMKAAQKKWDVSFPWSVLPSGTEGVRWGILTVAANWEEFEPFRPVRLLERDLRGYLRLPRKAPKQDVGVLGLASSWVYITTGPTPPHGIWDADEIGVVSGQGWLAFRTGNCTELVIRRGGQILTKAARTGRFVVYDGMSQTSIGSIGDETVTMADIERAFSAGQARSLAQSVFALEL